MANKRFIDFPIAASVGDNDIVLIWQDGLNKQTTKATLFAGSPNSLAGLTDVDISALANGQILQYNSTTSKWENVDRTDIDLDQLGDVTIVSPTNGQVLVYNSSTSKWENSSAGFVPYTGAVTTVNLGAQSILAGSFVKAGGTSAQFLKADGSVDSNTYLTTGSAAATYVPYTGATADVDLGTHDLTAERGTFTNNGSSDTLTVNHTSGSGYGIIVTKGGNNEALYVSKTSGSGNAMTVIGGDFEAPTIVKTGGTSSQFLKADGSVDSSSYVTLDTAQTITAKKTFTTVDYTTFTNNDFFQVEFSNGSSKLNLGSSSNIGHIASNGELRFNTNYPTDPLASPKLTIASDGQATFTGNIRGGAFIKSGGTSAQFLKADGSVDSTSYGTGSVTSVAALTLGTSGTDLSSSVANGTTTPVITLNVPTASATNRGALSSADWTTFNNKQNALTNPVTGTGTTNYLPKFTGSTTIGNSLFIDTGANAAYNNAGVLSRTFVIQATSGRPLALEVIENANVHAIYFHPNNSGFNRISSDYMSGGVYLPLSLTGRENNADLVLQTNGNVTIGTTTDADFKLDVNGTARVQGAATFSSSVAAGGSITTSLSQSSSTNISVTNTNASNGAFAQISAINAGASQIDIIAFGSGSTGTIYGITKASLKVIRDNSLTASSNGLAIGTDADVPFYVFTNSSERIRVTNSGNVGIGLPIPLTKLSVKGTAANPILATYNGIFGLETVNQTSFQMGIGTTFNGTWFQSYNQPATGGGTFSLVFNPLGGNVGIGTASPSSKLQVAGSFSTPHVTKSANYTLDATDYTVGFDCASNRTANLPDATTCAGRIYVIYQYNTNLGIRYVTLDGNGSQTINGITTYPLQSYGDFSSVMIQSTGSNWVVISDALYFIPL